VQRPASRLLSLGLDDSSTANASPRHDAGGGGPSKFAVRGCRSGRLPFVSMVTRFPSLLRSDHDDRGPADRVEDRRVGALARWPVVAVQLGAQQILAVDLDGNAEVMATVPTTMPFSIDWLPDGRLLVVAGPEGRLLRQEPDGSLVDHADLRGLEANLNELVVDGRARVYLNGGTDFHPGEGEAPGFVALVTPDGVIRRVAEGNRVPQRDGGHP
jgi:sugar lactone lactonase YvrE